MRLLSLDRNGELELTNFDDDDTIPPYAILSHTWGEPEEELLFNDVMQKEGRDKPGFKKAMLCLNQAAMDDFSHVWIDTCCIDKSDMRELDFSLNSMFRWYRECGKCYVFLPDVHKGPSWETAFRKSKWFTRGWTLQELLAPESIEFYFTTGELLGSKETLHQKIKEITKIPASALRGAPLSQFTYGECVSWAVDRKTRYKEDAAYSLMGILNVSMRTNYGEGREKAFKRLQRKYQKERDLERSEESLLDAAASSSRRINSPASNRSHSTAAPRHHQPFSPFNFSASVSPNTTKTPPSNSILSGPPATITPNYVVNYYQSPSHAQRSSTSNPPPKVKNRPAPSKQAPSKKSTTGKEAKEWSAGEDRKLVLIVGSDQNPRWKTVADLFLNRSPYACEKRYEKLKGKQSM